MGKRSYQLGLFLMIWLGAQTLPALDPHWLAGKIQEKYEQTEDFQADFLQISQIASLPLQAQEAQGRVYLKKPDKMRWEYETPEEQLILADGEFLWIYDPSLNQVIRHRWEQGYRSRIPALFLAGLGKLEREFSFSLPTSPPSGQDSPSKYWLRLVPRDPGLNLTELILGVERDSFLVVESHARDRLGNVTRFYFSHVKINQGIPDRLFHFERPEGAEQLDSEELLPLP